MHLAANEKDKKYFKSPPWTQTFCVSPLCTEFKGLRVSPFLCELHAGRGGMGYANMWHYLSRNDYEKTCCYGNGYYNRPSPYFSCFPWTIKTANCDEFGGRPLYRDSLGKLWRYKCLIHISRHRVSCLSFRWESCKFLYLLAVVTIDWTDWSQNPLRLINPLSVFFIFLLRNSKYHSRFSSYDLVFGYEHCQPWPLYFCMAISLSLLSQMAPSWSLVLASCLQERYPREASLEGSIKREWSFIA